MQGPGRPDEDTRNGFDQGGWGGAAEDPVVLDAIGERLGPESGGLLLGRRSYDDMLGAWNERGGPFKEALNAATKYVASKTPETELRWPNSILLSGDVPGQVAGLKGQAGGNLVIMGSGELIRSLLPHATDRRVPAARASTRPRQRDAPVRARRSAPRVAAHGQQAQFHRRARRHLPPGRMTPRRITRYRSSRRKLALVRRRP